MFRLPLTAIIAALIFASVLGWLTGDYDEPAYLIAVGMFVAGIGFGAGLATYEMKVQPEPAGSEPQTPESAGVRPRGGQRAG